MRLVGTKTQRDIQRSGPNSTAGAGPSPALTRQVICKANLPRGGRPNGLAILLGLAHRLYGARMWQT